MTRFADDRVQLEGLSSGHGNRDRSRSFQVRTGRISRVAPHAMLAADMEAYVAAAVDEMYPHGRSVSARRRESR